MFTLCFFNSASTSEDETEPKKSKSSVLFETPPASTPSTSTGKGGRRKSKSAPTGPRLDQVTSIDLEIDEDEIARLAGMSADPTSVARPSRRSIADIEEQREVVKRQKVADLLDQRRREREAAFKKASTSNDAKVSPTDPASHLCTA